MSQLSKAEYQLLVEQAPILIWRAGTDALCDYFNDRWLVFRGRTLEQEAGDGWTEGVHPEDFDRCLQTYRKAFERRETFEMEYRLRRFDGAWRWIFDRGTPFYDHEGRFAGYIGSCIDVTGRVEAERTVRRMREAELANLRGLLPICCYCKNIRDDSGYWQRVDEYITQHAQVMFSHGVCPHCMQLRHPGYTRGDGASGPESTAQAAVSNAATLRSADR